MIYNIKSPKDTIESVIRLPGSKSISNRLLIMSALSDKRIKTRGLSESDDTTAMINNLGSPDNCKNVGHAGTAMRFLTSYYACQPGEVTLTGSERMKKRPIGELVENLKKLGADITYIGEKHYPPLFIRGGKLKGGSITVDGGISSQFISSLLMIAPMLPHGLEIRLTGNIISASYINLTLQLMKRGGIKYSWNKNLIRVEEGSYNGGTMTVEPDWSAASYWYEIASLSKEPDIYLDGLSGESLQGDAALGKIYENLGVRTEFEENGVRLIKTSHITSYFEFDFTLNPDLVQTLIPTCVLLEVPFRFSGTQTLRIKETDRILAMYNEMKKFGVEIDFDDTGEWISWNGKTRFKADNDVIIETYKDHRMAMSFAPIALKTKEIKIRDPQVVTKSYPLFWDNLFSSGFKIIEIP
jgi:3-phosphoshikimate 1-carboxyvinyltransferase